MEAKFFEPETHNIPGRELSVEEQTRTVSKDRFHEWMIAVGEDYVDQTSMNRTANLIFIGFLLGKYPTNPEINDRLLKVAAMQSLDTLTILQEVYEDCMADQPKPMVADYTNEPWEIFYTDLAEFVNLTQNLKAQINANLILVTEHRKR